MLIWMRNSTFSGGFKIVLMGMLIMALAGLVLMDVGGFFTGNMNAGTVAKGGGVTIGANEFARTVDRALARQGIGAQDAYQLGLVDEILRGEIQNRLFTKEAQALGLVPNDETVMAQIAQMTAPLATEGRTRREVLQNLLRTQGISESEFVGGVRQELGNMLLRAALSAPPTLSNPLLASALQRFDNETRAAEVIVFQYADIKDAEKPTDEQLQKFYDANKGQFLIPETRVVTMATLKPEMLRKNVKVGEEEVRAVYEKNIASYTKPERRKVSQVVLKSEEEAQKAVEEFRAGQKPKNTIVNDYDVSGLLPPVSEAAFAASVGDVIGPIQTDLGWHAAKIDGITAAQPVPFDTVKGDIRKELESAALTDEIFNAGNAIEDRAAAGDAFADIVRDYGMTTEEIGPFRRNGKNEKGEDLFKSYGADRESLLASAFDFEEGEVTPIVETDDGQYRVLHIDAITPDTYKPLEKVRETLEKQWLDEQRALAARETARTALKALNDGKALADIAKENDRKIRTFDGLTRKSNPPAPLTAVAAAQIFATQAGAHFSTEIEDGVVIGTVTKAVLPSDIKNEDELEKLVELTGASLAQDSFSLYLGHIVNSDKIRINKAALDQMYGAPPAQ